MLESTDSDNIPNEARTQPMNFNLELQRESESSCTDLKKEQQFFHLIWGYESEEPKEKRSENSMFKNLTNILESNETFSHRFEDLDELENANGMKEDSPVLVTMDYQSKMARNVMPTKHSARSDMASQKRIKYPVRCQDGTELARPSHIVRKNKENSRPNNTKFSPVKHHPTVWNSPAKWNVYTKAKSCQTPTKSTRPSMKSEDSSLDLMFTQDSEGFCVIANHSQWSGCQPKDQTNSHLGRNSFIIPAVSPCGPEFSVESKMLFTQDSQGNMVIKH